MLNIDGLARCAGGGAVGAFLCCCSCAVTLVSGSSRESLPGEPRVVDSGSDRSTAVLSVLYPVDKTLFPPDMAAPVFCWQDSTSGADTWRLTIEFQDRQSRLAFVVRETRWIPQVEDWQMIRQRSLQRSAHVTIQGFREAAPTNVLSSAGLRFQISADPVGAPIFFREVELPLVEAAKDPARLRWRLGSVSSPDPPRVVLERMPFCGNCHSFSSDGRIFAMDVDFPSKGAYAIVPVAKNMVLEPANIINWDDYRREDKQRTFGLLSQLSPDGRFVISTVKDKNVFIPRGELSFSQLFFPIRGILAIYDRTRQTFQSLPGADDPAFVQSNPVWSPDGKYIVFVRSTAYPLPAGMNQYDLQRRLIREFDRDQQPFLFDLYRIPFNNGLGGQAEPLEGASRNGVSNFFPKYSPDGKWVVFCRARSYMMLQPDSELYIVPADGGQARRLRANTALMNSWHSWSPNSRWLVFASKAYSRYTQLMLTHIDESGNSSPAVVLAAFSDPERAANIPEFISPSAPAIETIAQQFAHEVVRIQSGNDLLKAGQLDAAVEEYRQALLLNPKNGEAHQRLGLLLFHVRGSRQEGLNHLAEAVRLGPQNPYFQHDLGLARLHQGQLELAINHLNEAMRLILDLNNELSEYNPFDAQYKLGFLLSPRHARYRLMNPIPEMEFDLGLAQFLQEDFPASSAHFSGAVNRLAIPNSAKFQYLAAMAFVAQGKMDQAKKHYAAAVRVNPEVAASLTLPSLLGQDCALADRFHADVQATEKALNTAPSTGGKN